MILCRSRKVIADIIRHLLHLDVTGWCVFGAIVVVSLILTFFSRSIIGRLMVAKGRIQFPEFEWIAMPKVGGRICVVMFCLLFSFLGYFSPISEDIHYFRFYGLFGAILFGIMFFLPVNLSCAIMRNKGELYLARYSGLGKFIPVKHLKDCILIEKARENEVVYQIQYDDKKTRTFGYIIPSSYTHNGMLKVEELKQSNLITIKRL